MQYIVCNRATPKVITYEKEKVKQMIFHHSPSFLVRKAYDFVSWRQHMLNHTLRIKSTAHHIIMYI